MSENDKRVNGLSKSDALGGMNERLAPIADALSSEACRAGHEHVPAIFIVGLPRSGTTLMHQLLAKGSRVEYVDQVVARFWLAPLFGRALSREVLGPEPWRRILFESNLGVSRGVEGPHEFGYFWNHWMGFATTQSHNLSAEEIGRVDVEGLRSVLLGQLLSGVQGEAYLFKNLTCGFQATFLAGLVQPSLFILVERDLTDVAYSLLSARRSLWGNSAEWFSLKPSTYSILNSLPDPIQQVAHQVIDCSTELASELFQIQSQVIRVGYTEMCEDPRGVVTRVARYANSVGIPLTTRLHELPRVFEAHRHQVPGGIRLELESHGIGLQSP